jgi:hypothetical protein
MKNYSPCFNIKEVTMFSRFRFFTLLLLSLSCAGLSAQAAEYSNADLGVFFTHPDNVVQNAPMSADPLKIPFTYGKPPMSVYVLLKDTGVKGSLEDFIRREHAEQKAGGYSASVEEHPYTLPSGQHTVEIIRKTPYGTTYYLPFSTPRTGQVMALWLMTNSDADPNGEALKAYNQMKATLNVAK